jgi:hypothetical protein
MRVPRDVARVQLIMYLGCITVNSVMGSVPSHLTQNRDMVRGAVRGAVRVSPLPPVAVPV